MTYYPKDKTYYPDFYKFYDDIELWDEEFRGGAWFVVGHNFVNKDRVLMTDTHAIWVTPLEYAENSWLPNEPPEVRCEYAVVGYLYNRYKTVGIAPIGKDVHHIQMNAEQLDAFIALLQVYRKHMEDVTND